MNVLPMIMAAMRRVFESIVVIRAQRILAVDLNPPTITCRTAAIVCLAGLCR